MNEAIDIQNIRQQLQQNIFKRAASQTNNSYSKAVFSNLANCHTAKLGMHQYRCFEADCYHESYQYHSCGNRHCPNCGGTKREQWLEDKTSELLPTSYFHMVFTLPHELNSLIMGNRKVLFKLLFDASSQTILTLAKDPKWLGATPGIISILHTWGQDLSFHPHIHCIVSGGGVDKDNNWVKEKRENQKFMFPESSIRKIYKRIFMDGLRDLFKTNQLQVEDEEELGKTISKIGYKKWNVDARSGFGGPKQVLEYLGRYTHKVAITAHRILEINEKQSTITFKYKDYHAKGTVEMYKVMTLSIDEFIRRFEQHILPKAFVKIRHYGYLKNHNRTARLRDIFAKMNLPAPPPKVQIPTRQRILEQYGKDITLCPKCQKGKLELVATYRKGKLVEVHQSSAKSEVGGKVLAPP
jgi:Putative transposase/Transposase zinc-binding domain